MITEMTPTGVLDGEMCHETAGARPLGDQLDRGHTASRVRRTLVDVPDNADEEPEIGGDPACWAHLVCPECGRFAEGDSADTGICAICGAALPSDHD